MTRSSRWRNCTGGSSSGLRTSPAARRARPSQPGWPSATGVAGRSTVTVVPGCWSRHSEVSRSISAFCTAKARPGSGRSGASSVSGTGLVGQAPYTVADDSTTTWAVPAAAAASSTRRAISTSAAAMISGSSSTAGPNAEARWITVIAPSTRAFTSSTSRSIGRSPAGTDSRSSATTVPTAGSAASRAHSRRPSAPAAPVTTISPRDAITSRSGSGATRIPCPRGAG